MIEMRDVASLRVVSAGTPAEDAFGGVFTFTIRAPRVIAERSTSAQRRTQVTRKRVRVHEPAVAGWRRLIHTRITPTQTATSAIQHRSVPNPGPGLERPEVLPADDA